MIPYDSNWNTILKAKSFTSDFSVKSEVLKLKCKWIVLSYFSLNIKNNNIVLVPTCAVGKKLRNIRTFW